MINLDNVIHTVKEAAALAGQKTSELYELSKLKMRVLSLRSQLGKEYKKLGKALYLSRTTDEHYDIYINGRIEVISAIFEEINEINEQISGMKPTVEEEPTADRSEEIQRIRAEIAEIKNEINQINE